MNKNNNQLKILIAYVVFSSRHLATRRLDAAAAVDELIVCLAEKLL
jgi:hypothetical protein